MDDIERQRVKEVLSDGLRNAELAWVESEVSEFIGLGVATVREFRRTERKGVESYEEVLTSTQQGRQRREEFVSQREMNPAEELDAVLDAIERVAVVPRELADVATALLHDDADPVADRNIEFFDEADRTVTFSVHRLREADPGDIARAVVRLREMNQAR